MQNVMFFGTGMTSVVVALCFCFRSSQEIEQELKLRDLRSMEFQASRSMDTLSTTIEHSNSQARSLLLEPMTMCSLDFILNKEGYVWLTCPLGSSSKASRIRILTKHVEETEALCDTAKQFRASLARVDADSCILHFCDVSRPSLPVNILWLQIYLNQVEEDFEEDPKVETSRSAIRFRLDPGMMRPRSFSAWRILRAMLFGTGGSQKIADVLQPSSTGGGEEIKLPEETSTDVITETPRAESEKIRPPNLLGAKVIVVCDFLAALGAGFSLVH